MYDTDSNIIYKNANSVVNFAFYDLSKVIMYFREEVKSRISNRYFLIK